MLIVMHHSATDEQVQAVTDAVAAMGLTAEPIPGSLRTAIGVLGNQGYVDDTTIRELPGVREVIHVSKPYKLVSRDFHPDASIVEAGGVKFGDGQPPVIIAGPCTVESEEQMVTAARAVGIGDTVRAHLFRRLARCLREDHLQCVSDYIPI